MIHLLESGYAYKKRQIGFFAAHTYEDGACDLCGAEEPKSSLIWIIVGAVAVVAIAAVAVIVIKKKK